MTRILGMAVLMMSISHAGELKDAITAGKACEKRDGYVQATPGNETEVAALVNRVNAKRQGVYTRIAKERGVPCTVVAAESAQDRETKNPGRFCK